MRDAFGKFKFKRHPWSGLHSALCGGGCAGAGARAGFDAAFGGDAVLALVPEPVAGGAATEGSNGTTQSVDAGVLSARTYKGTQAMIDGALARSA